MLMFHAGNIGLQKDQKIDLLEQALSSTEQLLKDSNATVTQTGNDLIQARESISLHKQIIAELQASVAALECSVNDSGAAVLRLQEALEAKQRDLDAASNKAAASDAQLQQSLSESAEHKSKVVQLLKEVESSSLAVQALELEQSALVQCITTAEDIIALKDQKACALQEQLDDMDRLFSAAAESAADLEHELEQVTSLADVTQLQLDAATAEAAAAAAESSQLQEKLSALSQRAHDAQELFEQQQHDSATKCQALIDALASKEADLAAASSRAETMASSIDRLQQLLRDVQDSASAAELRSNIAEELAREMYSHTQASTSLPSTVSSSTGDEVHDLRGKVAALQLELRERSNEQMEWLQEMDAMRTLLKVMRSIPLFVVFLGVHCIVSAGKKQCGIRRPRCAGQGLSSPRRGQQSHRSAAD
jgi:chromosome segregation ATPase